MKPVDAPEPTAAPAAPAAAPSVDPEVQAHADELAAHAVRVADSIAADMNQAIVMGLASRWDAGLNDDDLAFMRPRIAEELRAHLEFALQARGLVTTRA